VSRYSWYKAGASLWVNLAQGLVAESRGDFAEAEIYFRNALDVAGKGKVARDASTYDYNSRGRYASSYLHLANNLLLQGRLHEAENQIRELLGLSSQSVPEARARALELFGRILLEQGRFNDAEKIITLAMEDFRIGCVALNNIALISAKETFGKVLILQGKSAEAHAYFEDIEKAIDSERSTFELLLEENIFRVIALLQVERWRDARSVLQRNIDSLEASFEEDKYKVAERKGLLAITFFETGEKISPLQNDQVRDIMLDHLDDLYQFYGERTGVRVARKHLSWYCAGLENPTDFRSRVVCVESASEQIRLTRKFFDQQIGDALLAA
jgi:tetratricopeptide (TPR) repeat protein